MIPVWLVFGTNFMHLVLLRTAPWPFHCIVAAYALLLLTFASYILLQLTPPGSPPSEWVAAAECGRVPSVRDPKTEAPLPPRARYVRRAGVVVLGLDHFCEWLGVPVGLRNRKFYLQFTLYSLALVALALVLNLIDLGSMVGCVKELSQHSAAGLCQERELDGFHACVKYHGHSVSSRMPSLPRVFSRPYDLHPPRNERTLALRINVCLERASQATGETYAFLTWFMVFVNLLLTLGYGRWAWVLFSLAAHNRTVLRPSDDRYDVGAYANLRQIFGDQPLLWALPLPNSETPFDGLDFPLNPKPKEQHTEEAAEPSAPWPSPADDDLRPSHRASGPLSPRASARRRREYDAHDDAAGVKAVLP